MIENRNTATSLVATGYITPYIRLATHIGYCCAVASNTDKPWDERSRDLRNDLREALRHLDNLEPPDLYVSTGTCAELQTLRNDVEVLLNDMAEDSILVDLQNLCHNIAFAIAKVEADSVGFNASAGTEI